jgi:RsiW-degrading membrane proteinase PrsW (M82 family)
MAWWVVGAFLAGGLAGILIMAIMYVAASEPEQPSHTPNLTGHAS